MGVGPPSHGRRPSEGSCVADRHRRTQDRDNTGREHLFAAVGAVPHRSGQHQASACGWGQQGGGCDAKSGDRSSKYTCDSRGPPQGSQRQTGSPSASSLPLRWCISEALMSNRMATASDTRKLLELPLRM